MLLCGLWVLAPSPAARGAVVMNEGFENNDGVSGHGADWWATEGRVGIEGWAAHSGSWGMAIYGWDTPPTYGFLLQDVPAAFENFAYTFSIWANKDSGFAASTAELTLSWYSAGSVLLGAVTNNVYAGLNDTWQQFSVMGTAPQDTAKLSVQVNIAGIASGGALKFDDASLFEQDLSGSSDAVPEPSTTAFLILGVGLAAALRHGRRSKAARVPKS